MDKKLQLGVSPNYHWIETENEVDMSKIDSPPPVKISVKTELKSVKFDLNRTALMVIDMQNDFCTKGGWLDSLGYDYTKDRKPIEPLKRFIPECRSSGMKIIWLNWGNRKDKANLPPNQMWCSSHIGHSRVLYGDLNNQGSPVLDKDSWGADVVDELKVEQKPEDIFVDKYRFSGFWDSQLDSILRNLGIRTILFTGVNTDQCVHHTLSDANFLGYGCIMVKDCCSTTSPDYCSESTYYNVKNSFGFLTNSQYVIDGMKNKN